MPRKVFLTTKVEPRVKSLIRKYQGVRESESHVIERAFDAWETLDAVRRGEFPIFPRKQSTEKEEVKHGL